MSCELSRTSPRRRGGSPSFHAFAVYPQPSIHATSREVGDVPAVSPRRAPDRPPSREEDPAPATLPW